MSAFKKLSKSDFFVIPYTANKEYIIPSGSIYYTLYEGQNITGSLDLNLSVTSSGEYKSLIYSSINHLFYQNYSSSLLNTHSLASSLYYESASSYRPTSSYFIYNENQSLIKDFPTSFNSRIKVFSFSKEIFGIKIKESTFRILVGEAPLIYADDGKGNIYDITFGWGDFATQIGNIYYSQGIVVITNSLYQNAFNTNPYTIYFSNVHPIFEQVIKCNIKEHEMNCSYNPSLKQYRNSESSSIHDFATGSLFQPYITTVGLYNDNNELLAVAKMAKPIPLSQYTDTNIIIKMDV